MKKIVFFVLILINIILSQENESLGILTYREVIDNINKFPSKIYYENYQNNNELKWMLKTMIYKDFEIIFNILKINSNIDSLIDKLANIFIINNNFDIISKNSISTMLDFLYSYGFPKSEEPLKILEQKIKIIIKNIPETIFKECQKSPFNNWKPVHRLCIDIIFKLLLSNIPNEYKEKIIKSNIIGKVVEMSFKPKENIIEIKQKIINMLSDYIPSNDELIKFNIEKNINELKENCLKLSNDRIQSCILPYIIEIDKNFPYHKNNTPQQVAQKFMNNIYYLKNEDLYTIKYSIISYFIKTFVTTRAEPNDYFGGIICDWISNWLSLNWYCD